ncbi:MAG: YbaB/EbfC family nucleoid-associated protein [Phycisphaerae bacterium]
MFGNIGKMMKLAGEMQQKMPEMQEKLANSSYSADAGGGAVTAIVNGKMQLTDLAIQPDVLADADAAMIEDLIKAAISAAQTQAAQAAKEAMEELTGGMDIPGLGGMLGM